LNTSKKIGNTSLKATFFATILFWTIIGSFEGISSQSPLIIIISIIPILIICFLAIIITIAPIFSFLEDSNNEKQIFKKCFPFYAISSFIICAYSVLISNFDEILIAFIGTAFFTSIISWVWYSDSNKSKL